MERRDFLSAPRWPVLVNWCRTIRPCTVAANNQCLACPTTTARSAQLKLAMGYDPGREIKQTRLSEQHGYQAFETPPVIGFWIMAKP